MIIYKHLITIALHNIALDNHVIIVLIDSIFEDFFVPLCPLFQRLTTKKC